MNALPPVDVARRAGRLRERFDGAGIDALLVTRLPNVRYLAGFTGSSGMLLVGPDQMVFVTDGRYGEQAAAQLRAAGVDARLEVRITQPEQRDALKAASAPYRRIGLEAHGVTWAQQRDMSKDWFPAPDHEIVATEQLVEDLRRVKDAGEVARIRAACEIADEALVATAPRLHEGITEREFALALELEMRRRGASGVSFDPIVASGPNGAMPHARPSDRPVGRGELVVLDFGCVVDGYCSDMTRTVSVGAPDARARELYDLVLTSQRAGRDAVRAGVECSAVDRASRAVIVDAGLGAAFSHGTGHGVGLEIHEAPRVAATARGSLTAGDVVTVEPGVYVPGVGGVRIEDTVLVTGEGADPLTAFPKDLVL